MKDKLIKALRAKFLGESTKPVNRERSIIILVIGFTLLFILFIAIRINYNNQIRNMYNNKNVNNIEEVDYLSIDKLFSNYEDNYKYYINIIDNELNILFDGSINNNIDIGKKIVDKEVIEYQIDNDQIIDLNTNQIISSLYDDYLSYFFKPSNIYNFIKDLKFKEEIVDNKKIYNYNSIYNDSEIVFTITTSKDRLEEIKYIYNGIIYDIKLD